MTEPAKRGRPAGRKRITRTFSIHPDTEARIIAAAESQGLYLGEIVDKLAKKLPAVEPPLEPKRKTK